MEAASLVDEIRNALSRERRPASLSKIATKAQVDYDWLVKVVHGHIDDPGIRKIEAVRDALKTFGDEAAG